HRRSGAGHADGQLPHQPRHHRRQLRLAGHGRARAPHRPELRQQLGGGQRQLEVRSALQARHPRRCPLHALDHGRGVPGAAAAARNGPARRSRRRRRRPLDFHHPPTRNRPMGKTLLAAAIAAIAASAASPAHAGEGMWVPQQLPEIAGPLKRAGLRLDPEQLSDLTGDPLGAVVSLGGCTASFVSPQGLVATNHHCAYGAIQLNSTPERNLMRDGFYAAGIGDEISAGPNSRIYALESIQDVTAQVRAAVEGATDALGRTRALDAIEKSLVAGCEAEPGYRCRLHSFAGGDACRQSTNLEIGDGGLAYSPQGSSGAYGGEVDNWRWRRHSGDFAFFRAYVGPDGKPAAYSEDNVPYEPKRWLRFADKPLREGDFVMVAGYPGRTARYALASEVQDTQDWQYPAVVRHYKALQRMVAEAGKANPDIEVKYASTMRGWENVYKNYDSQLAGFERTGALATKQAQEAGVLGWAREQGEAGQAVLDAHAKLLELHAEARATRDRDLVFGQFNNTGVVGTAIRAYRLAIEREKPDAEREQGYQERDLPTIEGAVRQMERRYVPEMDRGLQRYWLAEY